MTVRRLKTYASSQGFAYQYYFVGKRAVTGSEANEYLFDVTSDRKSVYPVSIVLAGEIVAAWGTAHGRPLSDSEQYAAVKLRLLRAFDEVGNMQADDRKLTIDPVFLEESMASLGVE
jgi:hypothetical protein